MSSIDHDGHAFKRQVLRAELRLRVKEHGDTAVLVIAYIVTQHGIRLFAVQFDGGAAAVTADLHPFKQFGFIHIKIADTVHIIEAQVDFFAVHIGFEGGSHAAVESQVLAALAQLPADFFDFVFDGRVALHNVDELLLHPAAEGKLGEIIAQFHDFIGGSLIEHGNKVTGGVVAFVNRGGILVDSHGRLGICRKDRDGTCRFHGAALTAETQGIDDRIDAALFQKHCALIRCRNAILRGGNRLLQFYGL